MHYESCEDGGMDGVMVRPARLEEHHRVMRRPPAVDIQSHSSSILLRAMPTLTQRYGTPILLDTGP